MNKENIKKVIQKILNSEKWELVFVLIYPLLILFITESVQYRYVRNKQIQIIVMQQLESYWLIVDIIAPYLFILLVSLFFRVVSKNSFRSNVALTILCLIITIISYYKTQILNIPLVVADLFLAKDVLEIAGYGNITLDFRIIKVIIQLCLLLAFQFIVQRKKNEDNTLTKKQIATRIVLSLIILIMIANICITNKERGLFSIDLGEFDATKSYYNYGAVFPFFKSICNLFPEKLDDYTQENINKIKNESIEEKSNTELSELKPNIVVVMSESLFDVTQIENTTFSEDPLVNIRNISNQYYGGNIVSPVFGGGTSIPEFEFLTGLTSNFFAENTYPYSQYVNRNMNSIVKTYNNNKYETIAIHPNEGKFYNRTIAYECIGFEQKIFKEDIQATKYVGQYVSDSDLAKQIIKSYESENTTTEKTNKFIFAISIQNHTPYNYTNYKNYNVNIDFTENKDISEEEKQELMAYTQGVYDADKAFKELVNYFSKKEEPVILAIFGDHLPGAAYIKNTFAKGDQLKQHQTPYCVYTNYEIKQTIKFEENISAANLGLKLLQLSGINLPWYYKYIKNVYEQYPVITNQFIINANNVVCTNIESILIRNYEILQYDLLYKKKYIPVK